MKQKDFGTNQLKRNRLTRRISHLTAATHFVLPDFNLNEQLLIEIRMGREALQLLDFRYWFLKVGNLCLVSEDILVPISMYLNFIFITWKFTK
jgi:hypothetical protein